MTQPCSDKPLNLKSSKSISLLSPIKSWTSVRKSKIDYICNKKCKTIRNVELMQKLIDCFYFLPKILISLYKAFRHQIIQKKSISITVQIFVKLKILFHLFTFKIIILINGYRKQLWVLVLLPENIINSKVS